MRFRSLSWGHPRLKIASLAVDSAGVTPTLAYLWLNRSHFDALDGPTIIVVLFFVGRWYNRYVRDREELASRREADRSHSEYRGDS